MYKLLSPVCLQAIQRGCMEAARIHAENAVCQKHQSTHFLRMSVRVDAMASRVQTAVTMNQVRIAGSWLVEGIPFFRCYIQNLYYNQGKTYLFNAAIHATLKALSGYLGNINVINNLLNASQTINKNKTYSFILL